MTERTSPPPRRSFGPDSARLGLGPILLAILAVTAIVTGLPAATGNTTADAVLGQPDFVHNAPNTVDPQAMSSPRNIAIDASATPNHLYVVDTNNSRILGYKNAAALANRAPADLVIGQADFFSGQCNFGGASAATLCFPDAAAVDAAGNLYVADASNNRVLEYSNPFANLANTGATAGQSANLIFGQASAAATACNAGATAPAAATLCLPTALAFDSAGNLYVADTSNNRVLEFNTPLTKTAVPGSGDTIADSVFGQGAAGTSFTTNAEAASATAMFQPQGVGVDRSNNVYVSDSGNSRVLEFTESASPPANFTANTVFGQGGSFTTSACNVGNAVTASTLCGPGGLSLDSAGDLFVADRSNSRVLEYFTPLMQTATPGSGDQIADVVFGQVASFTSNFCNLGGAMPSASTLCSPGAVAPDSSGDLFVADTSNNRVLFYPAGTITAGVVLGQPDFVHSSPDTVDAEALNLPAKVAVDRSSNPNHLYVVDAANHRVLGYANAQSFASNAPAVLVIGQPDFFQGACNETMGESEGLPTAATLCQPSGVAVDGSGNLFVSDAGNNRVLEFSNPFANLTATGKNAGQSANLVFGQSGNFTSGECNLGAGAPSVTTLCQPQGLALDSAGNLYVADTANNRVLEFNTPLTKTAIPGSGDALPDLVLGQGAGGTNFTASASGAGLNAMASPQDAALDGANNLYVADTGNNRVLVFSESANPPSNVTPGVVFGQQGSFTANVCNSGGIGAATLCGPQGVALDSAGNAYIADSANERILEYNTPLTQTAVPGSGDTTADLVFGQSAFNLNGCNNGGLGATSLCAPKGVAVDSPGDLFAADQSNNRVLFYSQPLATPTPTPSPTPTASPTPTPSAALTPTPTAAASGTPTATPTAVAPPPTPTASSTVPATPPPGTPTATPTRVVDPIVPKPPVSPTASGGQVVNGGGSTIHNTTTGDQTVKSVTITFSDPALFSSATVTISAPQPVGIRRSAGANRAAVTAPAQVAIEKSTVTSITGATVFVFNPPFTLPAGTTATLSLTVTVSSSMSAAEPSIRDAAIGRPQIASASIVGVGGRPGAMPWGLMSLGLIGLPVSALRRRRLMLLAAGLMLLAVTQAGCDPCPTCLSGVSTQRLVAIDATNPDGSRVAFPSLPTLLSTITVSM